MLRRISLCVLAIGRGAGTSSMPMGYAIRAGESDHPEAHCAISIYVACHRMPEGVPSGINAEYSRLIACMD
jgi:hypothetical protein